MPTEKEEQEQIRREVAERIRLQQEIKRLEAEKKRLEQERKHDCR